MMWRSLSICLFLPFLVSTLMGEEPQANEVHKLTEELIKLRAEWEKVKADYEQRLSQLEARLNQPGPTDVSQLKPDVSATVPVAAPTPLPEAKPSSDVTFGGGARNLQKLNPEISATGDVSARYSDNHSDPNFNRLNFDGFEMAIQHPLDPYSQAKFFVTFEDGEFDLEEGYISWESLPGKLGLKVGRFHTNFGKLNRYHKHALPWADRDLPTQTLFGDEGLIGDGVSLSWLPPRLPIAQTSEIYFEVVNNSNDRAFSGKGFGDPIYVARLLNYYDVSDSAYFEWGLSAAASHWDQQEENRSTVFGLDLSYRWQPPRRALYRSFELRSELFYNDRRHAPGGDPFGMFVSGEYQLNRRWFAGLRYQFAQTLLDKSEHTSSFSPFLTFWQSEFVRLRAQYDLLDKNLGENENRFLIQFTWSLGPHKHEAY